MDIHMDGAWNKRHNSKLETAPQTILISLIMMRLPSLTTTIFLLLEVASGWTTYSSSEPSWMMKTTTTSALLVGGRGPRHSHAAVSTTTCRAASVEDAAAVAVAASSEPKTTTTIANNNNNNDKKQRKVAILLCPAQFCVPGDYEDFFAALKQHFSSEQNDESIITTTSTNTTTTIGTCRVAPLPRTEWIKVARQLPTPEFFQAKLPVLKTLSWYFDAMDKAVADIFEQEGQDVNLCIIGHSIGGWVARGYLGGLSLSSTAVHRLAMERCTSFITLGTPHISPETALVDQTRGLLRAIEESPTCSPQALADRGIDITCVSSSALGGNFFTTNIEELVAASSYLPLLGRMDGQIKGDGIVPLDLAFMDEPARRVIIDECSLTAERVRHSHVVPTPWNLLDGYAPSIRLPDNYPSYVSPGVLPLWAKYIR